MLPLKMFFFEPISFYRIQAAHDQWGGLYQLRKLLKVGMHFDLIAIMTAEAYLKPSRASTMELFCINS